MNFNVKNASRFIVILSVLIVSIFFINADDPKSNERSDLKGEPINSSHDYQIKALKIPKDLNFAGERVELEKTDILERIDRELLINTYWQSNALLWFKRTHKYFPIIEPILKEKGVPDDFKYLAVIESDLRNVTSPAGAKGMWQMLKGAARENGLEVNTNVDERYHLEKATRAACDYLTKAEGGSITVKIIGDPEVHENSGHARDYDLKLVLQEFDAGSAL